MVVLERAAEPLPLSHRRYIASRGCTLPGRSGEKSRRDATAGTPPVGKPPEHAPAMRGVDISVRPFRLTGEDDDRNSSGFCSGIDIAGDGGSRTRRRETPFRSNTVCRGATGEPVDLARHLRPLA